MIKKNTWVQSYINFIILSYCSWYKMKLYLIKYRYIYLMK